MASTPPSLSVGYWNIRGLAAPLRMMLMYTNTAFNCEMYDLKVCECVCVCVCVRARVCACVCECGG